MPSRTHILDFLIRLVTFLCIVHSHSSDRRPPIRSTLTLSISHLVSTRKPSHLSAQQPSNIHNKLYISLILIMHDIELNPGPRSPKFNPASAGLSATLATSGITPPPCTCHQPPTNLSTIGISWHCASCSIIQFTSSLPNYPTPVNNSFSSLDITTYSMLDFKSP